MAPNSTSSIPLSMCHRHVQARRTPPSPNEPAERMHKGTGLKRKAKARKAIKQALDSAIHSQNTKVASQTQRLLNQIVLSSDSCQVQAFPESPFFPRDCDDDDVSLASQRTSEELEDEADESPVSPYSYDEACLKTIVFTPGALGMHIRLDDWSVTSVGGLAERLGVKPGWLLLTLNGQEVSLELANMLREGGDNYTVVFYADEPHAVDDAPSQEATPVSSQVRQRKTWSMEALHDQADSDVSDQQQSPDGRMNSKRVLLGRIRSVVRIASRTLMPKSSTKRNMATE